MSSRLDGVADWEAVVSKANYRLIKVSQNLHVSRRTLHTFIINTFGCSPRYLFEELRLHKAFALLSEYKSLKEIAAQLSMTPASLCRFFNRTVGCAPGRYPLSMSTENEQSHRTTEIAKGFDGCSPARRQYEPCLRGTKIPLLKTANALSLELDPSVLPKKARDFPKGQAFRIGFRR
jgi:AraC-like DNA-binding protein